MKQLHHCKERMVIDISQASLLNADGWYLYICQSPKCNHSIHVSPILAPKADVDLASKQFDAKGRAASNGFSVDLQVAVDDGHLTVDTIELTAVITAAAGSKVTYIEAIGWAVELTGSGYTVETE